MERVRKHLQHIEQAHESHAIQTMTEAQKFVVNEPSKIPLKFGGMEAAKAIYEQGVKQVYCLTGGHVSPILVGCNQLGIRVLDVRDEVTTVFAADATSRVTGIPGVAIVTAGPGLSNTITAVKNAQMAEVGLVVFGGATAQLLKGRGALQDIDQHALMGPHCKATFTVTRVKDMIPIIRKAFDIARSNVPGPVFVEFPLDTLWPESEIRENQEKAGEVPFTLKMPGLMEWAADRYQTWFFDRVFKDGFKKPALLEKKWYYKSDFKPSEVYKVLGAFRQCKKPLFIIGSQTVLRVSLIPRLVEAIEHLDAPVYLSGMARGLLGRTHPLQMRHKRTAALGNSDFVLLCGTPADFRLNYGRQMKKAFFVQVDLGKETVWKNSDLRRRDVGVVGDPCNFILKMAELMERRENLFVPWKKYLQRNQEKRELDIEKTAREGARSKDEKYVHPVIACKAIENAIDDDSFLIADGGDFVGTASYIIKPRKPLRWLDPGVFGTLGVGAGFAIAAQQTHPDSEVWILYGDGAFGWSLCEFDTYCRLKLPVIAVIGNDACWSQMYRDQVRVLHDSVASVLEFTHYEKVAEGFGAHGILVEREDQLESALAEAKRVAKSGTPVCVNIMLTKSSFREGSISL